MRMMMMKTSRRRPCLRYTRIRTGRVLRSFKAREPAGGTRIEPGRAVGGSFLLVSCEPASWRRRRPRRRRKGVGEEAGPEEEGEDGGTGEAQGGAAGWRARLGVRHFRRLEPAGRRQAARGRAAGASPASASGEEAEESFTRGAPRDRPRGPRHRGVPPRPGRGARATSSPAMTSSPSCRPAAASRSSTSSRRSSSPASPSSSRPLIALIKDQLDKMRAEGRRGRAHRLDADRASRSAR